jgi:hypothetical protein
MKLVLVLLILALLIGNAFAVYVPYVPVVYQDTTNYNELDGCKPPIQFAQEHNCTLQKDGKYSVNSYTCGDYLFDANCDGAIYNLKVNKLNELFTLYMSWFVALIIISFIIAILFSNITVME